MRRKGSLMARRTLLAASYLDRQRTERHIQHINEAGRPIAKLNLVVQLPPRGLTGLMPADCSTIMHLCSETRRSSNSPLFKYCHGP